MALLDELYEPSYDGVPFIVEVTGTDGGQKDILKEFVNSNVQSVEQLGLRPRSYNLTAIIREPDYTTKKNSLLQVLEQGGTAILVHPFFGPIPDIVVRSWSLSENTSSLGDAQFSIQFALSETDGLPVPSTNTESLLGQLSDTTIASVSTDIVDRFNVTSAFTGNFAAAEDKVNGIIDALTDNSRVLAALPDEINVFNGLLDDLAANVPTIIQDPSALASSLDGLFTTFPTLFESAEDQTNALSLFFDFGDDDTPFTANTAGLVERAQNNDVLNGAVKTYAVSQAYVASAGIDFSTVGQINATADRLEEGFQSVKNLVGLGT